MLAAVNNIDQQEDPNQSRNDLQFQLEEQFVGHMTSLQWIQCDVCREQIIGHRQKNNGLSCKACQKHPTQLTDVNNMDPCDVPPERLCLSPVEKQLIAAVLPVISVYRVNGNQFAYRGQVINFPQDVAEFLTWLPYRPHSLSSILIVRRGTVERHSDFNVDHPRVVVALRWLLKLNPAYRDTAIDGDALLTLPIEGNIMDSLQTVVANGASDDLPVNEQENLVEANPNLVQCGTPIATGTGQAEQIKHHLQWENKENP